MKNYNIHLLAMLLGILVSHITQAQNRPDSLSTRLRVGLQTANNRYEVLYPKPTSSPNYVKIHPFLITVGVSVTSKVEVQLGYAYWREHYNSPGGTGTTLTGAFEENFSDYWNKASALPLLARYRLTKPPRKKVQFDVLLGTTFVSSSYHFQTEKRLDGIVVQRGYDADKALQTYITAGVGARVLFGRHWVGVWNVTASRNLKYAPEGVHWQVTGNRFGIMRAANVGVHYRFNAHLRKKKPAEV